MMGSLLDVAVRRAGEGGFDKPVAALAGGAAAALLFLIPLDVLQNLVIDSGLPSVFPPAEPPLGLKARLILAAFAAVIASASAYGIMRFLGRKPAPQASRQAEEDFFAEPAPRMRRRDLHPDAPVRAPLSASRHLGDPLEPAEVALLLTDPEPEPQPVPGSPAEEDELILDDSAVLDEPAPATADETASVPAVEDADTPEPRPQGDATIAELLARLERALEQKPLPQWLDHGHPEPAPAPARLPVTDAEPVEPMDARLRSALESLKRFAPSRG